MAMYRPRLSLNPDEDGTYTLLAVTETATGAHNPGKARVGVPRGYEVPGGAVGVLLPLEAGGEVIGLDAVRPVRHSLEKLELGAAGGHDMVVAFCTLGDAVLGTATIGMVNPRTLASLFGLPGTEPLEDGGWSAWADFVSAGPHMFHLRGSYLASSPGCRVRLTPVSQAVDPQTLVLQMEVTQLSGWWPQTVSRIPVDYDAVYAGMYNKVAVSLPQGSTMVFPVRMVT